MDWQQKAEALNALAKIEIRCRKARDWYVHQNTEIKADGVLIGAYGNGETPEAAIEDHWRQLVDELSPDRYIVTHAYRDTRRAVRWNGFMWTEVPEPNRHAPSHGVSQE